MARARKLDRFLSQPLNVAEQFTGMPGKYVKLEDTVRSFKAVVEGEHDNNPPHFQLTQQPDPDFSAWQEPDGNYLHGLHTHVHDRSELAKDIAVYYAITGLCYGASTIAGGAILDCCRGKSLVLPGGIILGCFASLFLLGWITRMLGAVVLLFVVEPRFTAKTRRARRDGNHR